MIGEKFQVGKTPFVVWRKVYEELFSNRSGRLYRKPLCEVSAGTGAGYFIVILDKLTYAGNLDNITEVLEKKDKVRFIQGDICDTDLMESIFSTMILTIL